MELSRNVTTVENVSYEVGSWCCPMLQESHQLDRFQFVHDDGPKILWNYDDPATKASGIRPSFYHCPFCGEEVKDNG